MPQVFGAEQTDLIAEASLWFESADLQGDPRTTDLFSQFLNQEGFGDREKTLSPEEASVANGRLTYSRSLGNKTIKDQPPRRDSSGKVLNADGYHEFVVHLNPRVSEGAKETSVGGPRRYELSYHHVDRNGKLHAMSIWSGNTPHGLNNAHEGIKTTMSKMMR